MCMGNDKCWLSESECTCWCEECGCLQSECICGIDWSEEEK